MARYLHRSCPRCAGYVGIVLRATQRDMPVAAVNGHCLDCGYRLGWIVTGGGRPPHSRVAPSYGKEKVRS